MADQRVDAMRGAVSQGAAEIDTLISSGRAATRIDLVRLTGLAASTISARVQELLDAGLVREEGEAPSQGGRRARLLTSTQGPHHVFAVDVGGSHARVAIADLTGALEHVDEVDIQIEAGPDRSLDQLAEHLVGFARRHGCEGSMRGAGVALPGPVNPMTGSVTVPSRMPGWRGYPVAERLAEILAMPVQVDNDANLMALGEHHAHGLAIADSVTVKAGTAIGAGVVAGGRLHRGATFFAGDITHVRVPAAEEYPCSCGNFGCLETIASGAALTRTLAAQGLEVASTADVVRLALQGEALATTSVRTAGHHLGEALCMVVNFFNPSAVFLGGSLSSVQFFVAAVRSSLYQGCHPLATERLTIARTAGGRDSGLAGAARLIIDHLVPSPPVL